MKKQRRGQLMKEKLLEEACIVFAEKGYRDATHMDICQRADANVASINYYFGTKENLYQAVFACLIEKAELQFPLDGGLPPTAAPEKKLQAFIHAQLGRMYDPEQGGLHQIRMSEVFDSTGLLTEALEDQLAQSRAVIIHILEELLGPQVSQQDIVWCEMSIVGQCFVGGPSQEDNGPRNLFGLHKSNVEQLTDHILTFSLAGVKAIRKRVEHTIRSRESGHEL